METIICIYLLRYLPISFICIFMYNILIHVKPNVKKASLCKVE